MPMRRVQHSNSSANLSAQAQPTPSSTKPSPSLPSITRSASPSGLSGFFSKPTKWFSRSTSGPRSTVLEPRPSMSSITSSQRKPTISGPTDPRPLPSSTDSEGSHGGVVGGLASRSVLDLSLDRASSDLNPFDASPGGLGDLRRISRKAWSRSADNLTSLPSPKLAVDTSFANEQKAKIEQYRNSPGTPSAAFMHYPFPTITTSPSAPTTESLQHVHSRSVSHTPHPVANTRLAPPSPLTTPRKKSADFERPRDKPSPSTTSNRGGAFSFNFSGATGAKPNLPPSQSTPVGPASELLVDNSDESKRASQIVHRSGFVNRLQNFTPSSPHLSSSKNWKPFKLVLKGSKLYFYKPPSDRSTAIKDLFPSGLVAVLEDALEQGDDGVSSEGTERRKDRDDARKKRAFWGRRTHPELAVTEGEIEKGSFEAFIHEAVFGTTFRVLDDCSSTDPHVEATPEWRRFASSILLCLPQIDDRTKFEAEFIRCASYLVSGAEETKQDIERTRITWLAAEYVTFHGPPVNREAWESFRSETIPNSSPADGLSVSVPPPSSSSTDGIFLDSPDMGAFSPRPIDADKLPTFASAFQLSTPQRSYAESAPRSSQSTSRSNAWSLLERDGFSREVFTRMDLELVAQSLLRFHRSRLDSARFKLPAKVVFSHEMDAPLSEFFGSDGHPHWLTRLIVVQILGPGNVSGTREEGDERPSRSSATHMRSEAIAKWAKLGELCRQSGDECSWRAIVAALCSKPIARLEKAWKRVDAQSLSTVRAWAYAHQAGEKIDVKEPRTTPWGKDTREKAMGLLPQMYDGKSLDWNYAPMAEARGVYDKAQASFSAYVKKLNLVDSHGDEDLARLSKLWIDSSKAPLPKSLHIDQYMSLSFAAEPRRKGRFAPFYWTRPTGNQGLQALMPLAFPEPLPTITLIDRSQIVRTKNVSLDNAPMASDFHMSRIMELKSSMESRGVINPDGSSRDGRAGNGLELGGTVLPVFDGELLLLVQPGAEMSTETTSRPQSTVEGHEDSPSRAPSIRVKSAAARLERKASRARRSSLPALSQRTSMVTAEPSSEPPLRVVVQSGTLDALVHLLVHGLNGVSVSVADDNGEMALRDGNTRSVKVDRGEFATVWWNVFRSFVSPLVLFELLRKQFLTKSTTRESGSDLDLSQTIRSRHAVIETMNEWIHKGGGAQDALDDVELYNAMVSFLTSPVEHAAIPPASYEDELRRSWEILDTACRSLLQSFISQTMRPHLRSLPVRGSVNGTSNHNFGTTSPVIDSLTPEELVHNLDSLAGAAFRNVVQDDLFVTLDLLEVQTADRTGWYLSREPSSVSDEVEIQTMFSHVTDVEPSSLIGDLAGDSFYRLLPPGIRSLIRAYNILRKWAISKVAAPNIGLKCRQARMELLLESIEVCRLRSSQTPLTDGGAVHKPCLRSFVEAVLTSVVVSPESRLFHRAWHRVAATRGATVDSLASLLANPTVRSVQSWERLTVDPAWLLERLLEVISLPDVLDSSSVTPVNLVNFDKRRHLCNLVLNSSAFTAPRSTHQRRETDRNDFERLNNIEHEVADLALDLRAIREDAMREAYGQASTANNKKTLRPFHRLVAAQQEKIKRDRYIRDRLMKEKRLEQQRHDRREEDINRAMEARKATLTTTHKQHRSKRSMSAFFRVMRPISTALSSDSLGVSSHRRNAADLDFTPTQKPALALSLVDARIAQFINNERSFTFQLDTEDGGHYLLQAPSKADMNKWISAIHGTVQSYAQRRLTYIGDSPKPQLSDHIHARPQTASRHPTAVFGVDLTFLLTREVGEEEIGAGAVPRVLDICLREIEARGLTEVGIYRVAGATTEVTALREALNNDIAELDNRLNKIKDIVQSLPRAHYNVLKRLVEHLDRVADFEDKNHMTPANLAVVFSPNLLRAPHNNFGVIMKNMGTTQVLTKALITHLHVIFSDADGDLDNEDDDDDEGEGEEVTGELQVTPPPDVDDDGEDLSPEPITPGDELPPEVVALTLSAWKES